MSLRLIKPGMGSANLTGKIHPKTGEEIVPIGYLPNGRAVWPVLGASPDDPDDPKFTGEGDDDEDEDEDDEDEDDEEEEKPRKRQSSKKSKKSRDDEDEEDDEDDEEDSRIHRVSQQAKRYRLALRAKEKEFTELKARLQAIEDQDKTPDEVTSRTISELKTKASALEESNRVMMAQLAFFKADAGIQWVDPTDAFALAERSGLFDDVIDEDGTVDQRELVRGLRALAKRKKYLVKTDDSPKARGRKSTDDDEDEDEDDEDEEPRSTRSARPMNSNRRGKRETGPDRKTLAKKFPVLNRL